MTTSNFRRQHDAALVIVGEIQAATRVLGAHPSRDQVRVIALSFARLTGLLRIHFAQEDQILYPKLMASGRGGVAALARRFVAEMGQIGPAYADFVTRWGNADAVMADPVAFRRESDELFRVLGDRIRRENEELYPLADEMDGESPIRAA